MFVNVDMYEIVLITSESTAMNSLRLFSLSSESFDVKCQLLFRDVCVCLVTHHGQN